MTDASPADLLDGSAVLVTAADALMRFSRGQLTMSRTRPDSPVMTADGPAPVAILGLFQTATRVEDVLGAFDASEHSAVHALISELHRAGLLVAPGHIEHELDDARALCTRLAHVVEALATDLHLLTSDALEVSADDPIGVSARLRSTLDAAAAIRSVTEIAIDRRQAERLAAIDLDPPLKLHVGSGPTHLEGWINLDTEPADVAIDLRRALPFADNRASHIFASHILEHLRHPAEARGFLQECLRVLQPGGVIRVIVPDIGAYLEAYVNGDHDFWDRHRETWWWWDHEQTLPLEHILHYAGVSEPAGAFFAGHRFGYDDETLSHLLGVCGFERVRKCSFQGSPDQTMRVDDISKVAHAQHRDRHLSLFYEATKAGEAT